MWCYYGMSDSGSGHAWCEWIHARWLLTDRPQSSGLQAYSNGEGKKTEWIDRRLHTQHAMTFPFTCLWVRGGCGLRAGARGASWEFPLADRCSHPPCGGNKIRHTYRYTHSHQPILYNTVPSLTRSKSSVLSFEISPLLDKFTILDIFLGYPRACLMVKSRTIVLFKESIKYMSWRKLV